MIGAGGGGRSGVCDTYPGLGQPKAWCSDRSEIPPPKDQDGEPRLPIPGGRNEQHGRLFAQHPRRYMPKKTIHTAAYRRLVRRLRDRRLELGYTQAQLAAKLSVTRSVIQKVENLERRMDVIETFDVLTALQLSVDEAVRIVEGKA